MSFYQDPGMDRDELREANRRHDEQAHLVTMWQRARYKGGFGFPPDEKQRHARLTNEEFEARKAIAQKALSV